MTVIPFPGPVRGGCSCGGEAEGARVELPVAVRAVARSRFDGEAKPQPALMAADALDWLAESPEVMAGCEIALHGPGDPLATPENSLELVARIRRCYSANPVTVTTLGLGLAERAAEFAARGCTGVTLVVPAVSVESAEKIYQWIRPSTRNLPLSEAVKVLLEEQPKAVDACRQAGLPVTIAFTLYPGANQDQAGAVAAAMAPLGASTMVVLPFRPPAGTEEVSVVDCDLIGRARTAAARYLKVIEPCRSLVVAATASRAGGGGMTPQKNRPNVAVASSSGMEVDCHLGQAVRFLVYGPREDGLFCLLGSRPAPEPGGGDSRWLLLADTLADCFLLLAAGAGDKPKKILADNGITVLIAEGEITGALEHFSGTAQKRRKK